MKGLQNAIGMTVVHPTWQKTGLGEHCGWVFAKPGQVLQSSTGYGHFAFEDVELDPFKPDEVKSIRDLY
jgi:hypothetical protein